MTTTTDKIAYANSANLTRTISGLAPSTTAGRQCTVIANSTNLYDDNYVTSPSWTNASTPASSKAAYEYGFGTQDGTVYDGDDAQPGASDAGYTINAASNLHGPVVISSPTASKTYYRTWAYASMFGGLIPVSWGIVICNDTNNNFATGAQPIQAYTGITYTNS